MTRISLLLITSILTVPYASAHIGNFAETKTIDLGGAYYVQIDPQPQPIYANGSATLFTVYVTSRTNSTYVTQFETIRLALEDNGTILDVPLAPTENKTLEGSVVLPRRGNYTTTLKIDDGSRQVENTTWMTVYHDYGYVVVPANDFVDPIVNETTVFNIQTIDPNTLERKDVATDMRFRIDHWDNAHARILRTYEVDLTRQPDGTFRFENVFDQPGQYHMYIASRSAGLDYGDVPMLHVFANEALPDEDNGIPFAPLVALAALALAALARRRA